MGVTHVRCGKNPSNLSTQCCVRLCHERQFQVTSPAGACHPCDRCQRTEPSASVLLLHIGDKAAKG
jgi:hypothetical protein